MCTPKLIHIDTTHSKHAVEIVKELGLDYDVLVTLSGDGLIHEAMNGFALHAQSAQAFNIPVAPIPTGSGNGTSLNLLGLEVSSMSIFTNCDAKKDLRMVSMCRWRL